MRKSTAVGSNLQLDDEARNSSVLQLKHASTMPMICFCPAAPENMNIGAVIQSDSDFSLIKHKVKLALLPYFLRH